MAASASCGTASSCDVCPKPLLPLLPAGTAFTTAAASLLAAPAPAVSAAIFFGAPLWGGGGGGGAFVGKLGFAVGEGPADSTTFSLPRNTFLNALLGFGVASRGPSSTLLPTKLAGFGTGMSVSPGLCCSTGAVSSSSIGENSSSKSSSATSATWLRLSSRLRLGSAKLGPSIKSSSASSFTSIAASGSFDDAFGTSASNAASSGAAASSASNAKASAVSSSSP
mmetsp:Transcript_10547/g.23549  ORF Transcript_10547/g.23549 Transcript_10547/m.23549 type:complete len:224 (+) Transcript_10547:484-1155(+)